MAGITPGPGGGNSAFNVSTTTVIKASPGTLYRICVITPPTANGAAYDSATTGGIAATNEIVPITTAMTAGTVIDVTWPCLSGITVNPGTSGVVSVSFL